MTPALRVIKKKHRHQPETRPIGPPEFPERPGLHPCSQRDDRRETREILIDCLSEARTSGQAQVISLMIELLETDQLAALKIQEQQ